MWILKFFSKSRQNTDASILVYKFRPEWTGFNVYAEYTQLKINFPCITTLDISNYIIQRKNYS